MMRSARDRRTLRRRISGVVAFALLSGAKFAAAGTQNVPCGQPFVFPEADVNVVVLPFTVPPDVHAAPEVGRKLSALVQLEVLLSIAKFRRVGAVQLVAKDGEECTAETVFSRLIGESKGAEQQVKKGSALVLVWGQVFPVRERIYLQTFVRFVRRGVEESLLTEVAGAALTGRLSSQAFASPPRVITAIDLDRVEHEFRRTLMVHREPNDTSSGDPIPQDERLPYWITDVRGEWLEVQGSKGWPKGWILARAGNSEWSLRTKIPELSFVEGVVGYLRYRIVRGRQHLPTPTAAMLEILRASDGALRSYLENWSKGALIAQQGISEVGNTPLCIAVPSQLRGMIALIRPDITPSEAEEAVALFARALQLVPYSADARNLTVIGRLVAAQKSGQNVDGRAAAADLLVALGSDPQNTVLLANLQGVYEGELKSLSEASPERRDLEKQIQAIKQVRERTNP